MKLFDDMTIDEKFAHLEKCRLNALECIRNGEDAHLADIADWPDLWGPWLIDNLMVAVEALKEIANEKKEFGTCPIIATRAIAKIGSGK